MGLAEGCVMKRDVKKDECIAYADVQLPEGRVAIEMRAEQQIGDIRDADALRQSMHAFKPDIVFHMAAQPLVRYSYDEPVETFDTNVMGTVNLLEAVRGAPSVQAVVVITTDKCYENKEWVWGYREHEAMGGHDPYSASKGCAELVTSAYRRSFFDPAHDKGGRCAVASARAGNVIGGGDWAVDRLIPDILRQLAANETIDIRNPFSIRPWQHVLEPLSGYMLLAQRLVEQGRDFADGWNFGPTEDGAKPVGWIADAMTEQWGSGSWANTGDASQPHEATYLKLDCAKARDQLGWRPAWNLTETLAAVVGWHKAWCNEENMREVSLGDIVRFSSAAERGD